jgi:hypothetical protein
MSGKSNSIGNLHQYYTTTNIKEKVPNCETYSPLEDSVLLSKDLEKLNTKEIESLKTVSSLSADKIIDVVGDGIEKIDDVGVKGDVVDLKVLSVLGSYNFSLKCSKKISTILSKNMGARSLLSKYFISDLKQNNFNEIFDSLHLEFLNKAYDTDIKTIKEVKKYINDTSLNLGKDKARFNDDDMNHMNVNRDKFLNELREALLIIIDSLPLYNIKNACNMILDTDNHHILGERRYKKECVEYVKIDEKKEEDILSIVRRGNDSVMIKTDDYLIGFRFKFESGITSSIKLVGDYKKY